MTALLVAIASTAFLAAVAVLIERLTRRRRLLAEVRRSGMLWETARAHLEKGDGTAIVDYCVGRSLGYGRITVWWTVDRLEHADQRTLLRALMERGRLTNCPPELAGPEKLRAAYPRAVIHANYCVEMD